MFRYYFEEQDNAFEYIKIEYIFLRSRKESFAVI